MSINSSTVSATSSGSAAMVLIGRALLSAMFIMGGISKLANIEGTSAWFGSIGLPMPTILTILVGLLELFGGLAVLVGFQTRLAAVALALFTIAASLIAHMDFADQTQMLMFMKNMGVAGGFLILAAFGPGSLSIDARR